MQESSSLAINSPGASPAPAFSTPTHIERLRVSELFRFFEPSNQVGPVPHGRNQPRIATDPTLTAFAQLAAFKLNCQRCFISLIDDAQQYIVAEATLSLSLETEDIYDSEDDRLYFGQTILDLKTGVCPGAMACFSSLDDSLDISTANVEASRSYYVMNDMSALESHRYRPYVADWPHMRYYAGVPIHSPAGYTIGAICVVDSTPRDGLDVKGLSVLREVANTVMHHLELCANKVQGKRAERMVQALGQFVQGQDSVRELWLEQETLRLPDPGMRHLSIEKRAAVELGSPSTASTLSLVDTDASKENGEVAKDVFDPQTLGLERIALSPTSNRTQVSRPETSVVTLPSHESTKSKETLSSSSCSMPRSNSVGSSNEDAGGDTGRETVRGDASPSPQTSDDTEATLYRAANLIREAIHMDGVVFFDSKPRTRQPKAESPFENPWQPEALPNDAQMCVNGRPLLDSSSLPSRVLSCSLTNKHSSETVSIPDRMLNKLLRQFTNGGILTFDSETVTRAVPLDVHSLNAKSDGPLENTPFGSSPIDSKVVGVWNKSDVTELKEVFPNIASLMIYPLWDTNRGKCVAYCMAWSCSSTRIFRRQDVIYLASFSNSIIAQLAKMESIVADHAKNAFISSISHELRSPLHGIMASIEILRDTMLGDSHHDTLDLVESCGSALLDTIDNVLAYSEATRVASRSSTSPRSKSPDEAELIPEPAVDMERLVEDVTSICLIGSQFAHTANSAKSAGSKTHADLSGQKALCHIGPIVICDIPPNDNPLFHVDRAIWKRILMNLLGNALKYTSTGFVIVKFEHKPVSSEAVEGDKLSSEAVLTIKDSGIGISQEYLNHHVFKPFHQENPLAPGTGLGLSIVSRLVGTIGGSIDIVSEEKVGTEIQITATLETDGKTAANGLEDHNALKGLKIGFFELNAEPNLTDVPTGILTRSSKAILALRSVITAYALHWGLVPVTAVCIDAVDVDILVVEDFRYQHLPTIQMKALKKPILILKTNAVIDRVTVPHENVVVLSSPFGPRSFKRSLESCLHLRNNIKTSEPPADVEHDTAPKTTITSTLLTTHSMLSPLLSSPIEEPTAGNLSNTSILLVEDNPINLKLLVACVTKQGHDFITSTNGAHALDAYTTFTGRIALVFMDIQMPIMDGMEATRKIRQYEEANSLPRSYVVALTALGSPADRKLAFDSGADMFLTKPVSLKTLKGIVMERHRLTD